MLVLYPLSTPMCPQTQGPTPSTHLRPETQAGLGRERLYGVAVDTSTQKGRGCLLSGASKETPDQGPPPSPGGWPSMKEKLSFCPTNLHRPRGP